MEDGIAHVVAKIGKIKSMGYPKIVNFDVNLFEKIKNGDPVRFTRYPGMSDWAEHVELVPELARLMSIAGPPDRLTRQAYQHLFERTTVMIGAGAGDAAPAALTGTDLERVEAVMTTVSQLQPIGGTRVGVRAVRMALDQIAPTE